MIVFIERSSTFLLLSKHRIGVKHLAIRLALGARPRAIAASVVRDGMIMVVVGLSSGVILVQGASRALNTVLFGVTPADFTSTVAAAAGLWVATPDAPPPAWRAMRVDLVENLRVE